MPLLPRTRSFTIQLLNFSSYKFNISKHEATPETCKILGKDPPGPRVSGAPLIQKPTSGTQNPLLLTRLDGISVHLLIGMAAGAVHHGVGHGLGKQKA